MLYLQQYVTYNYNLKTPNDQKCKQLLHKDISAKCLIVSNSAASANIWDRSFDINTFELSMPITLAILLLNIKSNW